jgi:hypothetical protein
MPTEEPSEQEIGALGAAAIAFAIARPLAEEGLENTRYRG